MDLKIVIPEESVDSDDSGHMEEISLYSWESITLTDRRILRPEDNIEDGFLTKLIFISKILLKKLQWKCTY